MKLPAEMMKLAQHIIRTKSAEFDPSMLEDHYRNALARILRKKQANVPVHAACGQTVASERRQSHGCAPAQRRGRAARKIPEEARYSETGWTAYRHACAKQDELTAKLAHGHNISRYSLKPGVGIVLSGRGLARADEIKLDHRR